VVIRPENEASQSLYKKLGFRKLYTIVRMTFVPGTWRDPDENDANSILRDNLINAVRQLNIQQNALEALQVESVKRDKNSVHKHENQATEAIYTRVDEVLEPIDERPEENMKYNDEDENVTNNQQKTDVEDSNKDCSIDRI
jgi:hypothetical protein